MKDECELSRRLTVRTHTPLLFYLVFHTHTHTPSGVIDHGCFHQLWYGLFRLPLKQKSEPVCMSALKDRIGERCVVESISNVKL